MHLLILYAVVTAFFAVANLPLLFFLLRKDTPVALNFNELQTQASAVAANAQALQTQAANSDDATNQAVIDQVSAALTSANATLAALVVPPAEPAL